jgi:putative tricarboxylic transport membrane protein
MRTFFGRSVAAAALAVALVSAPAFAKLDGLKIIAPAGPGGGWDQTARALQESFEASGAAGRVQVNNVPGAGGTIGLAQFVTQDKGNGKALLVGGSVMVGAIQTNKAPVTLNDITPIARLTGEYIVVVVPAQSELKTLDDLIAKFKADPQSVSWGGGSAGGIDHILVGLMAKSLGVAPAGINYIPFSGGGEALAALLGAHVTAGVSGVGEFIAQIEAGKLRPLAVSSPIRLPGVDAPTLKEDGMDIELANWRGILGAPNLAADDKAALLEAVDDMVNSPSWRENLTKRGWVDLYMPGVEFSQFLTAENERMTAVLKDIGLLQ